MSSSLPLACILTPKPRTKSLLSTSTPKLTTKTTFSHIHSNKHFFHYAVSPSTTDVLTSSDSQEPAVDKAQWTAELQNLVIRIQQLSSEEVNNDDKRPLLNSILKDFYSLGAKIFGLELPDNFAPTPFITRTLMNLAGKSKVPATTLSDPDMVPIKPIPRPGQASNDVDQLVQNVAHGYFGETLNDPPYYLTGNFAPVRQENPPTSDLDINGDIPESLNGMMLRNGPDPKFNPEALYSWMDGDSMVHGIKFKDGTATYVSRYVGTSRIIQEGDFDRAELFKYGDLEGDYGMFAIFVQMLRSELEILDMSYGYSNSNTGLVYHGGRIMALEDFGPPHAISVADNGDIETIGINNYSGVLDHWFTPHPKKDPITGEMFGFGSMYTEPYCIYNYVSKDGVMSSPVPITVSGPTYMHDLGLTENYVIIMDLPYAFSPKKMVVENEWVYSLDVTKKSRFGILPRYATSEEGIKWFEFDDISFFIFHNGNAWEDDNGNIIMYSCIMNPNMNKRSRVPYLAPAVSRRGSNLEIELTLPQMYKLTFNMSNGEAKREMITNTYIDYPKINENYMGRPTQYMYASEVNQQSKIPSIVKYDLNSIDGNIETRLTFDDGTYGSEVVFVQKSDNPTSEDDGYLITFVHNENTEKSFIYVIDALTMNIISTIGLPNRVPYGFHAIFVTEDELQAQIKTSF